VCLSPAVSEGRSEKVMEESLIIFSELPAPKGSIFKRTMVGVITLVEVRGSDLPPARKKVNLTPFIMIVSVATRFKRRRVSTLV